MDELLELFSNLRHFDSDVKWKASHALIGEYLKKKKLPASVLAMSFNILNGRAFDSDEEKSVRETAQNDMEKAIDAGIEKVVTMEAVIGDIGHKEAIVRVLAIENIIIACEYEEDITKALPALEDALNDDDARVRKNAAFAFVIAAEHGLDISAAVKGLASLAEKDKDEEVRAFARSALDTFNRMKEGKKDYA
jgi:hypothetical protein